MKKKILSLLLAVAMLCSALTVSAFAAFSDVSDADTAQAVAILQSLGIVDGVEGGRYSPDAVLTRAQFCTMIVRMMGLENQTASYANKMMFSDVKPDNEAAGYVNLAYAKGLIGGYGNGKFGPEDPITYGQAATTLLGMLNYSSAEIGKMWPADYVAYAKDLGLDEGLELTASDSLTRGEAAILLYNALKTEKKGSTSAYYRSINGVTSAQTVILLDTDATSGKKTDQLMVCTVSGNSAAVEYYSQKNQISAYLVGSVGELLLNNAGKAVGFIPSSDRVEEVKISSAKISGITDPSGTTHCISGSAVTIVGDRIYTWNSTGYLQLNKQSGKTARLYYNDDGAVTYVYLSTGTAGTTDVTTQVVLAKTEEPAEELIEKLGISGSCTVTKNGALADVSDLAQYDVVYYDTMSDTLCASDRQITGYIESAVPGVSAAETITISGCQLAVLESAWESLSDYGLGDRVTLLLTDDNKVAFATSDANMVTEQIGVLSTDGKSVTLLGSGLKITADEISASYYLYGELVTTTVSQSILYCSEYFSDSAEELNIAAGTLGEYELAPSCAIYEHAGTSYTKGYVYSLSGELGAASADFDDILWTDVISASRISLFHLNTAGKVDLLLLEDVTGNCYEYGALTQYTEESGINLGTNASPSYNTAVTLKNSANVGSEKYLYTQYAPSSEYCYGISLRSYNGRYQSVAARVTLTTVTDVEAEDVSLEDDTWYVTVEEGMIPVSDDVQVYLEVTNRWLSGEEGLKTALATEKTITLHYDRTLLTGAQVRVITVNCD